MKPLSIFLSFLALFGSLAPANSKPVFQRPALSTTQIAFVYAGDLWLVSREGGVAQRLTAGAGIETRPFFSPDGREIAFTGEYDGNVDVYVVATTGGIPKRITWHPAPDQTMGWTPDGKNILFSSRRTSNSVYSQLFTIPREGGFPTPLPLRWAPKEPILQMAAGWPTFRSIMHFQCGSAIGAAEPRRSG
jgi:tricorn protease